MKTLIIYDNTGKIYYQASGDITEPTGIPFLWVENPDGQYVSSIDISGETPTAVYATTPVSDLTTLQDRYQHYRMLWMLWMLWFWQVCRYKYV